MNILDEYFEITHLEDLANLLILENLHVLALPCDLVFGKFIEN